MLRKIIFIALFISGCSLYDFPEKDFEKIINFSGVEEIYGAYKTRGHGVIMVGTTNGIRGNYDLLLTRIDAQAEIMWTKTFGANNIDRGYSVKETSDGGFIVVGSLISVRKQIVIFRTNSQGQILWSMSNYFGDFSDEGRSVCELPDGGFVVCGTRKYDTGLSDILILRITKTGDLVWSKVFYGTNATAQNHLSSGFDIEKTSDGNLIVAGSVPDSIALDFGMNGGGNNFDLFLMKINPDGEILWRAQYDAGLQEELYDVLETTDQGFIAVGRRRFQLSSQVIVAHTDRQGNWTWVKTHGASGNDEAYSLLPAYGDGYVMAGRTFNGGQVNGLVMHIDEQGELLWTKNYTRSEPNEFRSIVPDGNNNYFLTGFKSAREGSDIYILKIKKTGEIVQH